MRRMTHIGRMTSGYFPRLKRSRRTSSAIPQRKETILLWVAWSMLALWPIGRAVQETIVRPIGGSSEKSGPTRGSGGVLPAIGSRNGFQIRERKLRDAFD